tara:strand:- start:175 stop:408 length:234 start_codon:yes stop_codon:yes gene_type:complete
MAQVKQVLAEKYFMTKYGKPKLSFFWNKYSEMKYERAYFGQENPYEDFQDYLEKNKAYLYKEYWKKLFENLKEEIRH